MYSKQEASLLRKKFWETAGHYFAPMPSAGLEKINWINYKTGVRFVSFKLHADDKIASIAIEISHSDPLKRQLFFNQFLVLKKQLPSDWIWEEETESATSRISAQLTGVNIYRAESWPAIISFFKAGIIHLDAFWVAFREIFEMLD